MKKDPAIYLGHILESIAAIEKYLKGMSEADFLKQSLVQDAVIRRLSEYCRGVRQRRDSC